MNIPKNSVFKFNVLKSIARFGIDIYAYTTDIRSGNHYIVKPVELNSEPHDVQGPMADPTLNISHEEAQNLIDGLWDIGIRPSRYHGSGETESMGKHINDLRKVAFKLLNIETPDKS